MLAPMSRDLTERRLRRVSEQLTALRRELAELDEQLAHMAAIADDARLRSLVSETPLAEREHKEAQRHADALASQREAVQLDLIRLEAAQDELLDQLTAGG